jgi:hypothetical protein
MYACLVEKIKNNPGFFNQFDFLKETFILKTPGGGIVLMRMHKKLVSE